MACCTFIQSLLGVACPLALANNAMNRILTLAIVCLLIIGSEEKVVSGEPNAVQRKVFVGTSANPKAWPYRYTLVREQDTWTGEIEVLDHAASLFFCNMQMVSSTNDKLIFGALYGTIGKALGVGWELSLSKSKTGFDGILSTKDLLNGFEPVRLKFTESKTGILPSSEREAKIRAMDDIAYRTEENLQHEVALAKQEWEKESIIANRISDLRKDDAIRKGVRREWVGPAWIRDRVKPEDSKYFERICCVYIGGTSVTNTDVEAISQLVELRELNLYSTKITNAALIHFDRLRRLRTLHLADTNVSDEGLESLRSLSNLRELYLNQTKVSKEGGLKFRAALPAAKVVW